MEAFSQFFATSRVFAAHGALDVLELLLGTFLDVSLESWTRKAAYCALLRASGVESEALPSECAPLDCSENSKEIDWGLVAKLQACCDSQADSAIQDLSIASDAASNSSNSSAS